MTPSAAKPTSLPIRAVASTPGGRGPGSRASVGLASARDAGGGEEIESRGSIETEAARRLADDLKNLTYSAVARA
ncbi:hypothetical protein [Kitasatospora sp. NPDC001225]